MWAVRRSQSVSEVGASLGFPAEVVRWLGSSISPSKREMNSLRNLRLSSRSGRARGRVAVAVESQTSKYNTLIPYDKLCDAMRAADTKREMNSGYSPSKGGKSLRRVCT